MYSTSDLTFVVRAQNYIKWAEFSSNHLLSMGRHTSSYQE